MKHCLPVHLKSWRVSPYVRNTSRTTQRLGTFVVHLHSPLHRQQQHGHVVTSRGRHVQFSHSYHSTCRRWIGTAPWSSRWSQLPAPPLRTQCSARSSYSGRECMLQLPTTYRGVCLSVTFCCCCPFCPAVASCYTTRYTVSVLLLAVSCQSL